MSKKFGLNNYIQVPGFAIVDLKLSGNELLVYSIIHGFSQDDLSEYNGSLSYMASAINSSTRTVINVLKSLVDKKLIVKNEKVFNGVKLNSYKVSFSGSEKISHVVKNDVKKVVKNFHEGSEKISHNNTINNKTHISEKNTCVSADRDLNKYFEELHTGKYKPDNVDRNHNAFTFENKELNDQLNINWEALVNQFNEITKKKAKAVLPRAKRQIMHLITNGYTKSDLVKVFTLASRDDWFKNNSNALNIDYLTREEVFTKYADI